MQHSNIKKPLKNWGRKTSTEEVSQELESTSNKGQRAEQVVLNHFLKQSFQLIARNKKVNGIEIDLIFFKDHFYFIEVKSIRSFDEIFFRVSKKQQKRLLYARSCLESSQSESVILQFAFVCGNDILVLSASDFIESL